MHRPSIPKTLDTLHKLTFLEGWTITEMVTICNYFFPILTSRNRLSTNLVTLGSK